MYADHFGFRELPFNNTPDPRFFYSTPDHEEALASLIYAIKERKGFVLLTGEIGAGKTLVTRMTLRHFGTQIAFATIHHAVQSCNELMESICTEFELPVEPGMSSTQLTRLLHDFLLAQFAQNVPVVLILDEAQNLKVDAFEQLRMIGNLEADDAKLLQIAIVGQPELQRRFLAPDLRQLRQRVFRSYHLPALNREATEEYIRHRLAVVTETGADVFDAGAIDAICEYSRGLPRIVNTLCDNALLSAYSADRKTIDRAFIASVITQMLTVGGTAGTSVADLHRPSSFERAARPPRAPADPVPALSQCVPQVDQPAIDPAAQAYAVDGAGAPCPNRVAATERSESPPTLQIDGELHARIDDSARRLAAVEHCLGGVSQRLDDARAVHVRLQPLVAEARTIVKRAETASQELQRRDTRFRKVATTVTGVVSDLRQLLNRAQHVAVKQDQAETRAVSVHDRLVQQSSRSVKVADELAELVNRMVDGIPSYKSRAPTPDDANDGKHSVRKPLERFAGTARVKTILRDTRSDLLDLRKLARRADSGRSEPPRHQTTIPTKRLAVRVDELLDIVESGNHSIA